MNPYFKRQEKKLIGDAGRRSEKRVIESKLGARLTVGSGNKGHSKGDGVLSRDQGNFRIEAKSTTGVALRVELSWLAKITREAFEKNQRPMVTVSFVNEEGKSRPDGDWVMVPLSVFRELT